MSVRSASRGSPAAKSIRLALRTSSIVETNSANFVRWVLRCFGRRRLSSELRLSAISVMPVMMRFQVPSRAQSLNHKPIPQVNSLASKLIDGKVHWVLDVVFGDDYQRLRSDYGPRNMALVQRIALNLIRHRSSGKDSLTVKRKKAGWSIAYLIETIAAVPA